MSRKMHCIYEIQFSQIQSNLPKIIREASLKDPEYTFLWWQGLEDQKKGKQSNYVINSNNLLTFRNKIYVPNQNSFKQLLLDKFHKNPYVTLPGYQKLLTAIRKSYLWL